MSNRSQIFTLEIDKKPILAFEAMDSSEAQEICRDGDLRADLCALTSDGIAICSDTATLDARPASPDEIASFERAFHLAPASDEPTMAFLIKIDGVVVVSLEKE